MRLFTAGVTVVVGGAIVGVVAMSNGATSSITERRSGGASMPSRSTPSVDQAYRQLPGAREFTSTVQTTMSQKLVGLCRLTQILTGPAGIYRVEHMVGVPEAAPTEVGAKAGSKGGFTYIELSLIEAWTNDAPKNPVVRVAGGPTDDQGTTVSWDVALNQGEVVGLVLTDPTPANNGYYWLHNLGVFRTNGGGASNGQLFTKTTRTLSEIGKLVRQIRAGGPSACAVDVDPDYGTSSAGPPAQDATPKITAPVALGRAVRVPGTQSDATPVDDSTGTRAGTQ